MASRWISASSMQNRIDGGWTAWRVAVGAAIGLLVAFGPAMFASIGLYVKPLSAEFGWSRTQISAILAISSVIGACGTPFLGFVLDRVGSRPVILVASVAFPAALLVLPMLPANYEAFLATGALLGLVSIIASPAPYISLLPQWFSTKLGIAVALAMFGSGFGQFGFAMLHGELLTIYSWRTAWTICALLVAIVGISNAWANALDRPEVLASRTSGALQDIQGLPLGIALRSATFWTAAIAFFFVQLITTGMLTHLAPLMSDRGWGVSDAARLVGLIGIFSLLGRIISGALLDRFGFGPLGLVIFPLQCLGCTILIGGGGGHMPLLAAACIGLAYGVEADMLPWMLRHTFGLRCFGRLYGIAFGVVQLGSMLGPLILGYSFDHYGSYQVGLKLLAAGSLASTALILFAAWRASRIAPIIRAGNIEPPATMAAP